MQDDPRFTHDGLVGWCAQAIDVCEVLPKFLGDDWRGPGPAIFLNLGWLREHAFRGQFATAVLVVLTHELGHIEFPLRMPSPYGPQAAEAIGKRQLAALSYSVSPENTIPPSIDDLHDWRWIRRVVHIYARAAFHGYAFGIDRMLHSGDCLFDAKKYVPILLTEALRMRNEPMESINALPPDEWLVGTYRDDIERFTGELNHES